MALAYDFDTEYLGETTVEAPKRNFAAPAFQGVSVSWIALVKPGTISQNLCIV